MEEEEEEEEDDEEEDDEEDEEEEEEEDEEDEEEQEEQEEQEQEQEQVEGGGHQGVHGHLQGGLVLAAEHALGRLAVLRVRSPAALRPAAQIWTRSISIRHEVIRAIVLAGSLCLLHGLW